MDPMDRYISLYDKDIDEIDEWIFGQYLEDGSMDGIESFQVLSYKNLKVLVKYRCVRSVWGFLG